ncbi:MAG: SAM-dependent DNA methyltransferase [Sandarakinorhabdus sp.]|nr:SAM-dependent DNA methyltransferase [Sandarakinorhabdus sp.]
MQKNQQQDQSQIKWISDFIWNIADDRLRDVYVRGKYRDVILPFTVLRRLDAVLEATKDAVLERKRFLDTHKVAEQDGALRMAAGQAFYNVSEFTLAKLKASAAGQRLRDDFIAYLDGFSPNVQEILTKFNFRNQIQKLVDSHVLGYLIDDFLDPEVNLAPLPVKDADGRIKLPALDNHGMGTVFEELIRRFNEENNEEAGEHFTPRDVVQLMAKLLFLPVADRIESSTYSLYDGSCGTGGMLTVAEEALHDLAEQHGKEVSIHLFGQEISDETYAICKADLLLKGEGAEAENIVGGADKSTLSADQFRSREFDFMISNPPYGKSWKTDLERMGGKKEFNDPRFIVSHAGNNEFKLITRSSDGQLLFQVNKLQKMKHNTPLGSRIALVHNGSALFTGDAGQGESNIRRWVLENDWLESIIALPLNIFYNTGIATYIWVLANKKAEARRGKVQLIDASQWFQPLRRKPRQEELRTLGRRHPANPRPLPRRGAGNRPVQMVRHPGLRLLEDYRRASAATEKPTLRRTHRAPAFCHRRRGAARRDLRHPRRGALYRVRQAQAGHRGVAEGRGRERRRRKRRRRQRR